MKPILYIKSRCPWCQDALKFFKENNIDVDIRDVIENTAFSSEMEKISGQSYTPTFVYGKCVIADFSVDEFKSEIDKYPQIKSELKLI